MDKSLKIQAQIRQNAEEVQNYLQDLSRWEQRVESQPSGNKTKKTQSSTITSGLSTQNSSNSRKTNQNASLLTPATILGDMDDSSLRTVQIPRPTRKINEKDAETCERERGNEEFQRGDFQAAVRCYTRCLGLKVGNYIAFSNRAMALLKLKEYHRAEADCDCALAIEPTHVKSLVRRATARTALGKYRAALQDLNAAAALEPSNKQIRADLQKTKELLRSAVNRAPLVRLSPRKESENSNQTQIIAGPDLPSSTAVNLVETYAPQ